MRVSTTITSSQGTLMGSYNDLPDDRIHQPSVASLP